MKKLSANIMLITAVLFFCTNTVEAGQNSAATVHIDVDTATAGIQTNRSDLAVGDIFDVDIVINGAVNLTTFDLVVTFPENILEIQAATDGNFLDKEGANTFFIKDLGTDGEASVTCSVLGIISDAEAADGDGVLAHLSFKVLSTEQANLQFPALSASTQFLADNSSGTDYPVDLGNANGATVNSVSVDPDQSTVEATTPVPADGTSTSTITITAIDTNGDPMPDIPAANIKVTSSNPGDKIVGPLIKTDASGQTTATISSTVVETKTISVVINGTAISDTAAVDFIPVVLPTVGFISTTSGYSESITSVDLEVVLSKASSEIVTVGYSVTTGTATGGDYTIVSGPLTFSPGEITKNITLTVIDDQLFENNETVVVMLSTPTGAVLGTNTTHTYTIENNDEPPTVGFAVGTSEDLENISPVLTVNISAASGLTATVQYSVTGGSATGSGTDYTLAAGTLTFPAGETNPQTISIPINDDLLDENDETIIVTLSNLKNADIGIAEHKHTILDNDELPSVEFAGTGLLQGEEGEVSQVSMDVELSTASGRTVTVAYSVSGDVDVGVDYTIVDGPLTFAPGETTKNITLTILDDSSVETDETIIVTLSDPTNATIGTMSSYTYTIINDDLATIEFAQVSLSGPESVTDVTLVVGLSQAAVDEVKVDYEVTGGGTATGGGVDYTLLGAGVLTFSVGDTSEEITITINDDPIYEGDETIVVKLSNPTNAELGNNIIHTYTIEDDEALPIVEFDVSTSDGLEDNTPAELIVNISAASGLPATVEYSVTGGSAKAGQDYTTVSGTLTFDAGDTDPQTISITINDDPLDENDETIIVTLSNHKNADIGIAEHKYTILDNDEPPEVSFTKADSEGYEGDEGAVSPVTLVVDLSEVSGRTVTVGYTVTGTADEGVDYTLAEGTLTFLPGETKPTEDIILTILGDKDGEPSETVIVTLSAASETVEPGTEMQYTYTILNDDFPSVAFAADSSGDPEADITVILPVVLSPFYGDEVTVEYNVDPAGTAQAPEDYIAFTPGVLTFPVGPPADQVTLNIEINIKDDDVHELGETIIVTLSNSTNAELGTNITHTYTIEDNDALPSVGFDVDVSEGDEDISEALINVSMSAESGLTATVQYSVTGGSAKAGQDYTPVSGTLTFPAGSTDPQTIKITINDDLLDEDDETITVELSAPENAMLGTANHTYKIIDNDDEPSVEFTSVGSQGKENIVSQVTLVVNLSPVSGRTVTVYYSVSGDADVDVDYTIPASPLIFAPGEITKNIILSIVNDSDVELDEEIMVNVTHADNAVPGAFLGYIYTILNDDQSSIEFAEVSSSGPEGNNMAELIVTLSPEFPGGTVKVNYSVTGGSATGGGVDYTLLAGGTLAFQAGDTEESIEIDITHDTEVEPDETIIVTLSNPSADATIGTNESHTYTILNDDDEIDPNISGFIPEPNSIQVARDTIIQLHITDEVIAGTSGTGVALETVSITVEDDVIYDGANETEPNVYDSTSMAQAVRGICRRVGTEADYKFVFQPSTLFDYEQEVNIGVTAKDKAGNSITEDPDDYYDYHFHTVMRSFGKNIKVNTDTGTGILQNNPATAMDSAGNIWVVWDETTAAGDNDIYIGKLPADGSVFEPNVPVISTANDQCNPAIAIDDDDKLYVVWEEFADPNWDILLLTSTDGNIWKYELGSDPCQVNADNPGDKALNMTQNPAIAISGTEMYVTWEEKRASNKDIWVRKSDIGQAKFDWKVATPVTTVESSQSEPAIAIDEFGTAYIVWTDARNAGTTGTDIYGADSVTGNWENEEIVKTSFNQWSPAIATESSGTVLHLLWVDDTDPNESIFYRATTDGLQGPLEVDLNVVDEPNYVQSAPAIAVSGAGDNVKVFACWQDERWINKGDVADIYFTESGSGFDDRTNVLVNDDGVDENTQTAPDIGDIGVDKYGNPYIVWVDDRNGNNDIYYAGPITIREPLPTEVKDVDELTIVEATTPDNLKVTLEIPDQPLGVDINDITIREIDVDDLPALPPGSFGVPYDLGPSGLVFGPPITITIQHNANVSHLQICRAYWYDEELGWQPTGGIPANHVVISPTLHTVTFETTHFTFFGVGASPGGGGGGGGGGCSMSPYGQGSVAEFLLPYVAYVIVLLAISWVDARRRRTKCNS